MVALARAGACAALIAAPLLLSAVAGEAPLPWAAAGGGAVALGLAAIRLSRGRWLSAPFLMLVLCTIGMAAGLAIDRQAVGADALAGLCFAAPPGFAANVLHHWRILPATHVAMLVGGFATIGVVELRARAHPGARCRKAVCGRAAFNLMCNGAMLAGMLLGGWMGPSLAYLLDTTWGIAGMVATMMIGMVWGMAGSMTVYRMGFTLADRRTRGGPWRRGPAMPNVTSLSTPRRPT